MALARLGVATCMIFSPFVAKFGGVVSVSRSVAFGVVLLCIAMIVLVVYFFMDKKLGEQTGEAEEKDEPFKLSDLSQYSNGRSSLCPWDEQRRKTGRMPDDDATGPVPTGKGPARFHCIGGGAGIGGGL